jgi:hypothetical protein
MPECAYILLELLNSVFKLCIYYLVLDNLTASKINTYFRTLIYQVLLQLL